MRLGLLNNGLALRLVGWAWRYRSGIGIASPHQSSAIFIDYWMREKQFFF
jgi:hypothetical protein